MASGLALFIRHPLARGLGSNPAQQGTWLPLGVVEGLGWKTGPDVVSSAIKKPEGLLSCGSGVCVCVCLRTEAMLCVAGKGSPQHPCPGSAVTCSAPPFHTRLKAAPRPDPTARGRPRDPRRERAPRGPETCWAPALRRGPVRWAGDLGSQRPARYSWPPREAGTP